MHVTQPNPTLKAVEIKEFYFPAFNTELARYLHQVAGEHVSQ